MPGFNEDFGLLAATTPRPIADNLGHNLDAAMIAAPMLRNQPDMAWAAAHQGGDVLNRAQGYAALSLINQIAHGVRNQAATNPDFVQGHTEHFMSGAGRGGGMQVDPYADGRAPTDIVGGLVGAVKKAISISEGEARLFAPPTPGDISNFGSSSARDNTIAGIAVSTLMGVGDHLKNTVFNPEWYHDNFPLYPGQTIVISSQHPVTFTGTVEPSQQQYITDTSKSIMQVVLSQFDTLQHMYRAVQVAYKQDGITGVTKILAPAIMAAAASVALGNPEAAPEAAAVSTDSLINGISATDLGGAAGKQAVEGEIKQEITDQAAKDAATAPAKAGESLIRNTFGQATKVAGAGMKGVNAVTTSPTLLAAQVAPQVYAGMGIDPNYSQIWDTTKNSNGMLTIGRSLSQALGLGQNSVLSGTVDGIVSLAETPMMAGRAAATEGAAKTLVADAGDTVNKAFATSTRYRNALSQISRIAKNAADDNAAAGQIDALFPQFASGAFKDPAAVKTILEAARTSPEELNSTLADYANVFDQTQRFQLPTQGLYGMVKTMKISDKKLPAAFSHLFTQAPMRVTEEGRAVESLVLTPGDTASAHMIGQLMRSQGIKPSVVDQAVGEMLSTTDMRAWENLAKNAIAQHGYQIIDKRMFAEAISTVSKTFRDGGTAEALLKKMRDGAALTDEELTHVESVLEPFRETYGAVRSAWHKNVGDLVGGAGGSDSVMIVTKEGTPITGGAVSGAQRAEFVLPRYQDLDAAMHTLFKNEKEVFSGSASFRDSMANKALKSNDFVNRWVNERFFKPLALATPGWAMRVSISEGLLNIARQGPGEFVAGRVGSRLATNVAAIDRTAAEITGRGVTESLAKSGYSVDRKMSETIALFTRGMMVGMDKSILEGIGKKEFIDNAARLAYRHDGGLTGTHLPGALDSRHGGIGATDFDRSAGDTTDAIKIDKEKFGSTFSSKAQGAPGDIRGWQHQSNIYATDPVIGNPVAKVYKSLVDSGLKGQELHDAAVSEAEKLIDAMPAAQRSTFERAAATAKEHPGMTPTESWATMLVDGLEGAVSSRSGYLNEKLLTDITNNEVAGGVQGFHDAYTVNADGEKLGPLDRPAATPWRDAVRRAQTPGALNKSTSWLHDNILGPTVNKLVRQPVFVAEFTRERNKLASQIARGLITDDQADVIAETVASKKMIRFIHNPADKTHFEEMMRTAAPFYFAQNQAFRRMGRLFAENPGAFLQYMDAMLGVTKWVSQTTAANGISLVNIPGIALWGMPFTASLSSLQTMDPVAAGSDTPGGPQSILGTFRDALTPKGGPAITIPVEILMKEWKALDANSVTRTIGQGIEGPIGSSQSLAANAWGALMPNSIVRAVTGYATGAAFHSESQTLNNTYMQAKIEAIKSIVIPASENYWNSLPKSMSYNDKQQALAIWQANHFGKQGSGPGSTQVLLEQAANRANAMFALKIFSGMFSPVAIGVGQYGGNRFTQMLNKYAKDPKYKGDYLKIVDAALHDNPWMTMATTAKSTSTAGYIPETKQTFQWMDANTALLQQYPLAALAFGPALDANASYFEPAHQLLVTDGLRQRSTPEEFVNSYLVAAGNNFYYNYIKPTYDAARQNNVPGAYAWEQSWVNYYGKNYNPVWLEKHGSQTSAVNAGQALKQLQDMMAANPELAKSKQGQDYQDLVKNWIPALDSWTAKVGHVKGLTYQDIKDWWTTDLDGYVKSHPEAKPGVDAVFLNLG